MADGERIVDEILSEKARSFSRSLLGMIETILTRNNLTLSDLNTLACTTGPGSFTGIRIGISTFQGITLSTGLPVYGVSTLEAMANTGDAKTSRLCPLIDAGKGGVYYASFENGKRLRDDGAREIEEVIENSPENAVFFGNISDGQMEAIGRTTRVFDGNYTKISVAAGAALAVSRAAVKGCHPEGNIELLRPNYIRKSYAEK